tara:strand:+ start:25 stop:441 length:417 start_codon:yes stop_codon:yes gene_type:complete
MFGIFFISENLRMLRVEKMKDLEKDSDEYNLYYSKRTYPGLFGYFMRETLGDDESNKLLIKSYKGTLFPEGRVYLEEIMMNMRNIIDHRFDVKKAAQVEINIRNFARQKDEYEELITIGKKPQYLKIFTEAFQKLSKI